MAESETDFGITRDSPYLTLMGELWGVYCEEFGENCLRHKNTTLYYVSPYQTDDLYILQGVVLLSQFPEFPEILEHL